MRPKPDTHEVTATVFDIDAMIEETVADYALAENENRYLAIAQSGGVSVVIAEPAPFAVSRDTKFTFDITNGAFPMQRRAKLHQIQRHAPQSPMSLIEAIQKVNISDPVTMMEKVTTEIFNARRQLKIDQNFER
jgi:hypothetical protein